MGDIQIRNIKYTGPKKETAEITFKSGVNVICGASDTGKSFIPETIDFMFGGSGPIRDIPERVGYDTIEMTLEINHQNLFTLQRSIEGGDYLLFKSDNDLNKIEKIRELSKKHKQGTDSSLSSWLLSFIGASEKNIKKNAKGKTQSLSFRDYARLCIVQETEITKKSSPFHTGRPITKTAEYSALKFLLTGIDDSSLIPAQNSESEHKNVTGKLELVEEWLSELKTKLEEHESEEDTEKLNSRLEKVQSDIKEKQKNLEELKTQLGSLLQERRETVDEKEGIKDRIDEIDNLLSRFNLLDEHYSTDIERLDAIIESGSIFAHYETEVCPLCGASPEDQHQNEDCDGNVEQVIDAANAEIVKIQSLSANLEDTVSNLTGEKEILEDEVAVLTDEFYQIDRRIRQKLTPELQQTQNTFSDLIEKKEKINSLLDLHKRIKKLRDLKGELENAKNSSSKENTSDSKISKSVFENFSEKLEKILEEWHFPNAKSIYFDEEPFDFVINGKPRISRGKGLRAITHAAVSTSLMEYCEEYQNPHPKFLVLDSPLLAYWKPEGDKDSLKGTDLEEKFYEYLIENHKDNQIIIIENKHPSSEFEDLRKIVFTKNPDEGRYGLFPYVEN